MDIQEWPDFDTQHTYERQTYHNTKHLEGKSLEQLRSDRICNKIQGN